MTGIMASEHTTAIENKKPHFHPSFGFDFSAPTVNIAMLAPMLPLPSMMPVIVLVTFFDRFEALPTSAEQTADRVLLTPWRKMP